MHAGPQLDGLHASPRHCVTGSGLRYPFQHQSLAFNAGRSLYEWNRGMARIACVTSGGLNNSSRGSRDCLPVAVRVAVRLLSGAGRHPD
jgi:hypothetical protein